MSSGNRIPARARERVYDRANGLCEVCGKYAPGADIHHRLAKGMGGTSNTAIHDPSNLLAVCGWGNTSGCHGDIHGNAAYSKAMGWIVSRFTPYAPSRIPVRLWDGMWWLNDDGTRIRATSDEVIQ
jgi:hypothetical protein